MHKSILKNYNLMIWRIGNMLCSKIDDKFTKKKIAILRTDSLGDIILFLPFLELLLKKYNKYNISIIIQSCFRELISKNFNFNKIICFNKKMYRRNPIYRIFFLNRIYGYRFNIILNLTLHTTTKHALSSSARKRNKTRRC